MKAKTCLRYPGGKFYALKEIRPFYQINHEEFREPFAGGISVFLDKELAPKMNWINDIDKGLITFFRVIQNAKTRKELFEMLKDEVATKERHAEIRDMVVKTPIEIAFKYFYLNRTSFSGIMRNPRWGYALGSSVTPDRWTDIIKPVADKLANKKVKITNLDFGEVISARSKNNVLMYIDPPYFIASKDIYRNGFRLEDHLRLCKLLKKTKFKFILSYEDSKEIREMYDWANINIIKFRYFLSEARRQQAHELIITNFDITLKKFLHARKK